MNYELGRIYDIECQTYDKHRICESKSCKCDFEYKEDSESLKCTHNSIKFGLFCNIIITTDFISKNYIQLYK
jgi:hypothetical protein